MTKPRPWPTVVTAAIATLLFTAAAGAQTYVDSEFLAARVGDGSLPPVEQRLPETPRVVSGDAIGKHGGDMRMALSGSRAARLLTVYGYSRLVAYNTDLDIVPDILEDVVVEEGRSFTFKLRAGHRWSDGHPFSTEDFRYWWEDVANNNELSPFGPPAFLNIDGEWPTVEIIDDLTIRYSWGNPNPFFLPRLAAPRPPFIYRPAHFMRKFHGDHADPEELKALQRKFRVRGWAPLHNSLDNMYDNDNPDLPTLQPWQNTVRPPSQQFVFERNPYFHRVDPEGQQLPYIDRVIVNTADGKLIPAKVGAGETDLQARNLFMSHYTFLRQAQDREGYKTHLWDAAQGARIALFPNLNHKDAVWRDLFRDVRFRRALSLAIDRDEINDIIYFGLGTPANNSVLPLSPLFDEAYQAAWTEFDPDTAEQLLDDIGLTEFNNDGIRLLPDGRPLEIVVETAGESTEQVDVLELIHDTWIDVGIKLFTRPAQPEVFRNRIFAGETQMSVSAGADNGIPTADMSPAEFAPTEQVQYQWPKWGQWFESSGQVGEAPDIPAAERLAELNASWRTAADTAAREAIWHEMLEIYTDNVFVVGIVCCTKQPVVVSNTLRNVPEEAVYSWDPGAHFGVYLPDTFFFDVP